MSDSKTNDRLEYRQSLGLPDLGMDEKRPCPRCGMERDRDSPDGCRDIDCPTAADIDLQLAMQSPGSDEVSSQCRRCIMCEGEEHHWMYSGNENAVGRPVMNCKHCDATRLVRDDD